MRYWVALLAAAAAMMLGVQIRASTLPDPALLSPDASYETLKPHIAYSVDAPRDELTELGSELLSDLRAVEHASIQFGQVGQSIVAFVPVRNAGAETGSWVLTTGRGALTSFRLYVDRGGNLEKLVDNSNQAEVKRTLRHFQAFATEFSLAPGEEAVFVIQFNDTASSYMPLAIQTSEEFFADRRFNVALVSGVVAGSLILIFFNVLMFGVTGKPEFVWLGAAELAFTFNTIHAEGYSTILLLYQFQGLQEYFGDIVRTIFSLLMAQFGLVFLQTRKSFPRFHRFLRILQALGLAIILMALAAVVAPGLSSMPIHIAGWAHVAVTAIALPVLAWKAMRRKGWFYWPLLVSWSSIGAYVIYMAVAISGIVPRMPVPWHWVGPVGLFECLMATVALGIHLRQIQIERVASEAAAKEALLKTLAISNEATQLAEERARALAAVQSRDRVIQASGHDTRHVLHALNSAIHYTRSQGYNQLPSDDLTSLIEASARHLDEIVATSASVGGNAEPFMALGVVDLLRVIRDIEAIYSIPAREAHIDLLRSECRLNAVITDEALIARALSNLVNNAIKFSDGGSITISCETRGRSFVISVRDQGPGLPPRVLEELSEEVRDQRDSVLGTGWRAIREIVQLLGGEYRIVTDHSGTEVSLIVPNPLSGHEVLEVDVEQLEAEEPRLALVDGDRLDRDAIEEKLETLGSDRIPVLVTSRSSSSERLWAATSFPVLLSRPLCLAMLRHPHFTRLQSNPSALASSTI